MRLAAMPSPASSPRVIGVYPPLLAACGTSVSSSAPPCSAPQNSAGHHDAASAAAASANSRPEKRRSGSVTHETRRDGAHR